MDYIAACDFFVGVDSGPMHIASALGKPSLILHQASNPALHISDQRDFSIIAPNLPCLSCNGQKCKVAPEPLCNKIDSALFAKEINRRLGIFRDTTSAVVCVYKPHKDRLNRCLQALIPQVDEIIIAADQASVVPMFTPHPKVRLVKSWRRDIGYGRKANFGVRNSSGQWVMLVNDDVYLEPDTVNKLRAVAIEGVGIVGHMLRYPDGKIQHGGVGRNGTGKDFMHLDHRQIHSRFSAPVELENVTGASILVRREAFYQAMGFDERFYLYCEDNDFCLKVRQKGWKIIYHPLAQGIHEESQSSRLTPNVGRIMNESIVLFHQKWDRYLKSGVFA
jgi:GT2 family glycosyltransferase